MCQNLHDNHCEREQSALSACGAFCMDRHSFFGGFSWTLDTCVQAIEPFTKYNRKQIYDAWPVKVTDHFDQTGCPALLLHHPGRGQHLPHCHLPLTGHQHRPHCCLC